MWQPLLLQQTGFHQTEFFDDFVLILVALGGVCILLWLVALWFARRRMGPAARYDTAVSVLRRIPLDRRRHLHLVRVADRVLLIGTGDSGPPSLIADLDPDMLERISRTSTPDRYG
jgi:flagellar biogenesis protein FliO